MNYNPQLPSIKTSWHKRMQAALNVLIKDVLNNRDMIPMTYRKLSLPYLMGHLGRCKVNLLVIGGRNSWLINARTAHARHFVGTRQAIGLSSKATNIQMWKKLESFAQRFAASGSRIKVFCLHSENGEVG